MSVARSVSARLAAPADGAVRLPLSGIVVGLSHPTGGDDLLLVEQLGSPLEVALQLLQRMVRVHDDDAPDLAALPLYDLDVLLLRLRQSLLGDRIRTDTACQSQDCAARMDISFGIDEYLEHHRHLCAPWQSRHWVAVAAEPGWFRLTRRADGRELGLFRLPTARDLLELQRSDVAAAELAERCIRPAGSAAKEWHLIERAMAAIAPNLSSDVHGACPECHNVIRVAFEPRRYCIDELRQQARFVMEDIDLLAERYHWSEREILALPNRRRMAYAELARQTRGVW